LHKSPRHGTRHRQPSDGQQDIFCWLGRSHLCLRGWHRPASLARISDLDTTKGIAMAHHVVRSIAGAVVLAAALAAVTTVGAPPAQAANVVATTIRVKDMHCEGCAAKIRRGLFAVAGVVNVKTNVKTHSAVVMPQRSRQPSPRAMWEAVEKAGFEVVRLEGPSGTFTDKPQQ
jgi:copper chaperone CopZ